MTRHPRETGQERRAGEKIENRRGRHKGNQLEFIEGWID